MISALLASAPRFVRWLLHQEIKLQRKLRLLTLDLAVKQAFQKFRVLHPHWADSLFDEYFLTGQAAPILARYLQRRNPPTPAELAAAWFEELSPITSARFSCQRNEVTTVATDFLCLLEAELRTYQMIEPNRFELQIASPYWPQV